MGAPPANNNNPGASHNSGGFGAGPGGWGVTPPLGSAPNGGGPPTPINKRGLTGFYSQDANPVATTLTLPDGTVQYTPVGGNLTDAPRLTPGAGLAGQYLNRLNMNASNPGADVNGGGFLTNDTRSNIDQLQTDSYNPRQNDVANAWNGASGQDRNLQAAALGQLGTAGSAFRGVQGGLLGAGGAASMAAGAQQAKLAAGAGQADRGSVGYQNQDLRLLANAAAGRGPSAAQAQFQSALDQNIAAQHSLAAGARGMGTAAAMRNANLAGAGATLQAGAQSAALRAQEQQAAQQALGNVSTAARAGDVQRYGLGADILAGQRAGDTASINALGGLASTGRAQDIGQSGQVLDAMGNIRGQDISSGQTFGGLQLGQTSLDDQRRQAAIQAGLDAERLRQAGINSTNGVMLGAGTAMLNNDVANRSITTQGSQFDQQLGMNVVGSLLNGGAGLGEAWIDKPK